MTKNTFGGNRNRCQGRKYINNKGSDNLRISLDPAEVYAIVTKLLGNNQVHVYGIDGNERLCFIRGKFSIGRNKRDNTITLGSWVLVGDRTFLNTNKATTNTTETTATNKKEKLPQCDLLEVYSDIDKDRLTSSVTASWNVLVEQDVTRKANGTTESDIAFATERDEEYNKLMSEINTTANSDKTLSLTDETENITESYNIDDI